MPIEVFLSRGITLLKYMCSHLVCIWFRSEPPFGPAQEILGPAQGIWDSTRDFGIDHICVITCEQRRHGRVCVFAKARKSLLR